MIYLKNGVNFVSRTYKIQTQLFWLIGCFFSYELFFLVFLDLTKLNSRLQFTLMWQEQSLAAVTISTSRMLLRGFSSSCLFHVNINMRESSVAPRVQSSTWLDPKKLTTWNLHKWLQSKLNLTIFLTIRVVTKILQRI